LTNYSSSQDLRFTTMPQSDETVQGGELTPFDNVARTTEFWARASSIYFGYKLTQLRSTVLALAGWSPDRLQTQVWDTQHQRAAEQMHSLCVDLRGFYLKAGQFLGARGDFVPEQICLKLSLLHDRVPPMPPSQVRAVIESELGGAPLDAVFEWIDLDTPLGSASISQVHKAKLKALPKPRRRGWRPLEFFLPFLRPNGGSTPRNSNRTNIIVENPEFASVVSPLTPREAPPVDLELAWQGAPRDGVVAIKVQYPNALPTMSLDLGNLRLLAAFLSKTELKFDMLSAVDELAKQIRLEFDFRREARIMDAVARQFEGLGKRIRVPRSVPGMVTPRLLVMSFLDGIPLTRLKDRIDGLNEATRRLAARRILSRVSEAYGRMVLLDGLFQADGHPGNILVMKGRLMIAMGCSDD
jgi:predicted unusual protein kinase regulating ubiquinone biosynthesis (AarF/ABC1/UbiB family)